MPETLDKKIRNKQRDIILTIDPQAKVYAFDTLSLNPEEWAGLFRIKYADQERFHGWVIKRTGIASKELRGGIFADIYTYDIWGFHGFWGTKESDNSDDIFQKILDDILEEFKKKMTLDLDCVKEHKLPQFPEITVFPSGKQPLHFAKGKIDVHLCERAAGATC